MFILVLSVVGLLPSVEEPFTTPLWGQCQDAPVFVLPAEIGLPKKTRPLW
jgi:hypothetical protein